MKYHVFASKDAEEDLFEIHHYISQYDSLENADYVFDKISETCLSLELYPNRGHILPELERIKIKEYREIHFKPYRIIYQIKGQQIFIHCIVDGRRNLQEFLEARLLR